MRHIGSNWLNAAAIVAGASFMAAGPLGIEGAAHAAWKGACVGLLTLWAAANARSGEGWLFVAVLAFATLGDVLLDVVGLTVGALAFLTGHLLATVFFLRHRARPVAMALPVVALVAGVAYLLPAERAAAPGIALYAAGLGMMAGAVLISRFPAATAIGAMLFVISDWLIFARMGPLATSVLPDLLVWPTYFAGQALIAAGVLARLAASSTTSSQRTQ